MVIRRLIIYNLKGDILLCVFFKSLRKCSHNWILIKKEDGMHYDGGKYKVLTYKCNNCGEEKTEIL